MASDIWEGVGTSFAGPVFPKSRNLGKVYCDNNNRTSSELFIIMYNNSCLWCNNTFNSRLRACVLQSGGQSASSKWTEGENNTDSSAHAITLLFIITLLTIHKEKKIIYKSNEDTKDNAHINWFRSRSSFDIGIINMLLPFP